MYKVSIFNNDIETIIHFPSADKNTPHLLNLPFKESLSKPDELSFTILNNNVGYDLINGLKTKVKVLDTRDNSIVFSGRVIPLKSNMANGQFGKEVTCEGALSYLNDTNTRRWNFDNQTPQQIVNELLWQHNLKVDDSRKMYCGIFEVTQPITIDTNYETTLNAIITKVKNILGGDIRVRETDGILYLDYLTAQGANDGVEIRLGYNLKDMIVEYDPMDIITRIIPLGYGEGINQLGISSVNSELEYIEDSPSVEEYGVIEGVITNKDLQNVDTLKAYGQTILNEKKQIKLVYSQSQLDLSVLAGHENEKYELGNTLHTICDVMDVDVYSRVIERSRDLINNPWNPNLVISTRPIRLSDQIIDLKQRNLTLENAPQGNTCIFPIQSQENADATHPIVLDLDIPAETININRVYINLHGRKYRAYETATASTGVSTETSASGGGGTTSTTGTDSESTYDIGVVDGLGADVMGACSDNNGVSLQEHFHDINWEHSHNAPAHTHDIDIPGHAHAITYGIYEGTFPLNVKVEVNGVGIGVNYGDGTTEINEYNIDITAKINIGNNKIEISTEQNGRIEAIIYSQIFIQSK